MERNAVSAFDQYAEEYDKWFDATEGKALFEMEVEAVKLLIKDLEKPFLEIGVGTGRFAKELGMEYGIDPSDKMLEIAGRRRIMQKNANEKLVDGAGFVCILSRKLKC